MKPSLDALPAEVLVEIFGQVCLHCRAQTVLYHEFVLGYGDSVCSRVYDFDGRLASFMHTVGRRRGLAAKVRKVAIQASADERKRWGRYYDELLRIFLTPELRDPRKAHLEIMGPPYDFRAVNAELINMLITLLPNVDHLSL
ncbi:hypothetical protein NCS55_00471200 [Fusarium keratoplasticum]|nr:hypothetical protein NCS55_00471200 [Fusarium keratoplasticum]